MEFYEATHGDEWTYNTGWGGSGSVCDLPWYGLSCDGDENVTSIYLRKNNLRGQLTAGLANLTQMQYL